MKAILVGCIAAGFAIKKVIDDELSEKLDVTMPDGKMVLIVDVRDPAEVNEDFPRVPESEHFVACGALSHGLLFYGPFANEEIAISFSEEIQDDYWRLNPETDNDVDRMIQQAQQGFNLQQKHVIETYENGDFSYVSTPKELRHCGDGLLQFAVSEISNQEGCDSTHDAALRMESAVQQLDDVVQSLTDIL